ncbi:hypothetical protein [Phaeodactylibacter xiamenensis]|uniref:hypothetical protein n=1 Tax=Phaeodactylibacter xiamenensis TaxID=1524460 RepID=UPI0012699CF6|nr:hypothetical protein [Phaeodactylibacter xiamenensis]
MEKAPLSRLRKKRNGRLFCKKGIKRECCEHWLPDKPGKILKMKKEKRKSATVSKSPGYAKLAFCCLRYFGEME